MSVAFADQYFENGIQAPFGLREQFSAIAVVKPEGVGRLSQVDIASEAGHSEAANGDVFDVFAIQAGRTSEYDKALILLQDALRTLDKRAFEDLLDHIVNIEADASVPDAVVGAVKDVVHDQVALLNEDVKSKLEFTGLFDALDINSSNSPDLLGNEISGLDNAMPPSDFDPLSKAIAQAVRQDRAAYLKDEEERELRAALQYGLNAPVPRPSFG